MPDATDESHKYESAAGELRDAIRRGDYALGSRLPSAAEIAATHSIHKNTANRVLRLLKAEGFAEYRRGDGTFVADRLPEEKLSESERVQAQIADLQEQIRQLGERLSEHEARS